MKLKSLVETTPHLATEWHPTRNKPMEPEQVTTMSRKRIWWLCNQGHTWKATVLERQKGMSCPKCSPFGSSNTEQQLLAQLRSVFPDAEHRADLKVKRRYVEIDIWIPSLPLAIEYDGPHHIKRDRKDEEKNYLLHQEGIQLIRIRTSTLPRIQWFGAYVITHDMSDPKGLEACLKALKTYIMEHYQLSEDQSQRIKTLM